MMVSWLRKVAVKRERTRGMIDIVWKQVTELDDRLIAS